MARVNTFRRAVTVFVSANLAPEARSFLLATAARDGLAELIASGQAPDIYTRAVDGVIDAPESAVKPEGVIAYTFGYMPDVAAFGLKWLVDNSPVRSGKYKSSFMVGVNGKVVPMASFVASSVPNDAEIIFFNTTPYSRKVDVQIINGGPPLRFSVPPDLFIRAGKAIIAKYGNAVQVKRVYDIDFASKYILLRGRDKGSQVQSPALIVSPR